MEDDFGMPLYNQIKGDIGMPLYNQMEDDTL